MTIVTISQLFNFNNPQHNFNAIPAITLNSLKPPILLTLTFQYRYIHLILMRHTNFHNLSSLFLSIHDYNFISTNPDSPKIIKHQNRVNMACVARRVNYHR